MHYPALVMINESSVLSDDDVRHAIPALQHQASYHFQPFWNSTARILFGTKGQAPPAGSWICSILDDSDQAGALGYHDMTAEGLPLLKVFAKTDQQYNLSWTVTASHEILEALADPYIALTWQVTNTEFYACEVGDPVEADQLGYKIGDVLVSDFILPAWFIPGLKVSRYDFMQHLAAPLQVLEGGYVSIYTSGQGWAQKKMRNGELASVTLEESDPRFRDRSKVPNGA